MTKADVLHQHIALTRVRLVLEANGLVQDASAFHAYDRLNVTAKEIMRSRGDHLQAVRELAHAIERAVGAPPAREERL